MAMTATEYRQTIRAMLGDREHYAARDDGRALRDGLMTADEDEAEHACLQREREALADLCRLGEPLWCHPSKMPKQQQEAH